MNVQVRLIRVAGVSNTPERLAHRNRVACTNRDAALTHVAQQDPHLTATQDHVMAGHVPFRAPPHPVVSVVIFAVPLLHLSSQVMIFFAIRRARLRPEYAHLYPRLAPGIWLGARAAARAVRRELVRRKRSEASGQRLLPEAHFEFRGGRHRSREGAEPRTRATDRLLLQSGLGVLRDI